MEDDRSFFQEGHPGLQAVRLSPYRSKECGVPGPCQICAALNPDIELNRSISSNVAEEKLFSEEILPGLGE